MAKWKTVLLGNICKTNTYSYSNKEGWEFVNYLDTGNITVNDIGEIKYIDLNEEKLPSRAKRKVKFNSIIYSTVRPNQLHYGIIKEQPENFLVSTGFTVLDVDETVADADFIYYWLTKSTLTEQLQSIAEQSVSTYPSIKPSDLEGLEIELPPLEVQKKIADILSSLDNKRKTNISINRNLAEQVKGIFKEWFIDYGKFDGVMPDIWKELTLEDVSILSAGGDKPKNVSNVLTDECQIPIYSNGISDEGLYGYTDHAKIFDESVTVSARGTIGYVCLREEPYVPIVRLVSLIPKNEIMTAKYLYLWLESLHIMGTGTTQQQLTVPDFKKTRIIVPNKEIVTQFTETVTPLFDETLKNKKQSAKLAELRDSLLPKLLSGEFDVLEFAI